MSPSDLAGGLLLALLVRPQFGELVSFAPAFLPANSFFWCSLWLCGGMAFGCKLSNPNGGLINALARGGLELKGPTLAA